MNGDLAEGVVPDLLREIYVGRRSGTLHLVAGAGAAEPALPPRPHRQRPHQRPGGAARRDARAAGAPLRGGPRPGHRDRGEGRAAARRGPRRDGAHRRERPRGRGRPARPRDARPGVRVARRHLRLRGAARGRARRGAHAQALHGRAHPRGGPGGPRPGRGALRPRRHGPRARALERPAAALPEAHPVPRRRLRAVARRRRDERPRDRADDPPAGRADAEEPPRPALDGRRRVRGRPPPSRRERARAPGARATAGRARRAGGTRAAPPPAPPPAATAATARRRRRRPQPAATDDKAAERRREILEASEGLKTRNHFEVLGLSRSVGEAEVKEAYFRLAKRFHPDVHHGASLGDLRDELEAVFIRLGEAYEVLRDPRKRGDYEERLGRPRPKPAGEAGGGRAPTPPEPPAPEPPRDPEEEARVAEESIRRAAKLLDRRRPSSRRSWGPTPAAHLRRDPAARAHRRHAAGQDAPARPAAPGARLRPRTPSGRRRPRSVLLAATRESPAGRGRVGPARRHLRREGPAHPGGRRCTARCSS